jgi:hypothetical protein
VGGCNTPKKKLKRGAQLAGRGPWHAGIANFLKIKISSLKILEISGKKLFCERFRELLFSKK